MSPELDRPTFHYKRSTGNEKMTLNPLLRPLGIAAAILGTLQGLLWTVLSLVAILLCTNNWSDPGEVIFNKRAMELFFRDKPLVTEQIFHGDVILGFACFYLVVSFIWATVSLTLIWVFFREKYDNARLASMTWSGLTILISVFDIVVMIILAIDLATIQDNFENNSTASESKFEYATVLGTVMTVFARGYVLLIIQVIIACFLYKAVNELPPPQKRISDDQPFINAYQPPSGFNWQNDDSSSRNPMSGPRSEHSNSGFIPDNDSFFHRSGPQETFQEPRYQESSPKRFGIPVLNPVPPPGKLQKSRAPAVPREPQPYIPPPDYEKFEQEPKRELERLPRSALRAKSYY